MAFEDRYAFENFLNEHLEGIIHQIRDVELKLAKGSGYLTTACEGNYGIIANSCKKIIDAVIMAKAQDFIPKKSGYAEGLKETTGKMRTRALGLAVLAQDEKNRSHMSHDVLLRNHFKSMLVSCRGLKIDVEKVSAMVA